MKTNKQTPISTNSTEPLKGCYFHSIINGKLEWQGIILRQWDDYVYVMTFEWFVGGPSCGYVLRISDLTWNAETKTGFYVYPDKELFLHSYESSMAHSAEQRNK